MRSTSERHRQYGDADSDPSGSSRPNPDQASAFPRQQTLTPHRVTGFNRLLHYIFPDKQRKVAAKAHPTNAAARRQTATTSSQPSLSSPPSITLSPPPRSSTRRARPATAEAAGSTPFSSTNSSRPRTTSSVNSSMPHHHSHSTHEPPLDISVHNDPVIFRGTGIDVEPATIRGSVILTLAEATDLREVIVRCIGKARVSVLQNGIWSQPQTTILYLRETELLEGNKSHPHTLKAGRHEFPFSFELEGTSAASLSANFGMAAIEYKLRATAIRTASFSTNFVSTKDVTVVRSFSNEALEFQQTLEIENTWPEKIQYGVILPHKAWAAGDRVSAILKFTPLAKGVTVASIKMGLQEKVRTIYKNASHEEIRVVCSKKETLKRGRPSRHRSPSPPVDLPDQDAQQPLSQRRNNNNSHSASATGHTSFFRRVGSRVHSRENLLGIFRTRTGGDDSANNTTTTPPGTDTSPPRSPVAADSSSERSASPLEDESEDVEVIMRMRIPAEATPSHSIGPIFVTHRIKWDVLLRNHDGHYSELRCSLPIHLLSNEVLEETLAATNATRTALLGESHGVQVQEIILPAYHDHIRDRVANAELHSHVLATNPLNIAALASAATTPEDELPELLGLTSSSYGPSSTLADQHGRSTTVPRVSSMPDASDRGRQRDHAVLRGLAEVESSELFLSLGRVPEAVHSQNNQQQQGQQGSGSHPPSQNSSRASSPERSEARNSRHTFGIRPFTTFRNRSKSKGQTSTTGTPSSSASNSRSGSSHQASSTGHGAGGARSHKGHKFSLSRSSSGPSAPPSPELIPPLPLPYARSSNTNSPTSTWTTSTSAATTSSDYYDTVPDYAFAARGFLGGGITPLSALRGLPSYNEAQRSRASSPLGHTSTVTSYNSSNSSGSRRRSLVMPGRRRSTESREAAEREREPVVPEATEVTASSSS